MNDFEKLGICPELAAAIEGQGIRQPTEIQRLAIPRVLAGGSFLAQAPTGTGKTLAYLLPLLQGLDGDVRQVQALALAPTYELGMQIARVADGLVREAGLPIRSQGLIGGASIARQVEKLRQKPQFVAGSAGRMLELARMGKLKLGGVRAVALDEFDRLLDEQNLATTRQLLSMLPPPGQLKFLLFSATAPKRAVDRAAAFLPRPEILRAGEAKGTLPQGLEHFACIVPFREKIAKLRRLARGIPIRRGLVFISQAFHAERTLGKLRFEGIRAGTLLGTAGKLGRQRALEDFRRGKLQLLLATELAARGLDIEGIDYVVNLDLPDGAQAYLHRAGRTARAGAMGRVITLADPREARRLAELEQKLGIRIRPWKT